MKPLSNTTVTVSLLVLMSFMLNVLWAEGRRILTPAVKETNSEAVQCGLRPYDHESFFDILLKNIDSLDTTGSVSETDDLKYRSARGINIGDKIIGGNNAVYGEFPWQARIGNFALTFDDDIVISHFCGAVIISEYWLLCAAHCFMSRDTPHRRVVIGSQHLDKKDKYEEVFVVDKIIRHKQYNAVTKDNDIALIKIRPASDGSGIKFNNFIQPACLPNSDTPYTDGTKCMISGWGVVTYGTREHSIVLQQAEVPLVNQYTCEQLYKTKLNITVRMFCAGHDHGNVDTCGGDSGGPIICKTKEKNGKGTTIVCTAVGDEVFDIQCMTQQIVFYVRCPVFFLSVNFAEQQVNFRRTKETQTHQFTCNNDICVNVTELCDGNDECKDNSHEDNCQRICLSLLQVYLVGGKDRSEGNVNFVTRNETFSVCDTYWNELGATAVCRMLGFSTSGIPTRKSFFGSDNASLIYKAVKCRKTVKGIIKCPYFRRVNRNKCNANHLAGVICYKPSSSAKRLKDVSVIGKCGRRLIEKDGILIKKRDNSLAQVYSNIFKNKPNRYPQTKIIGGQFAEVGYFPWLVRIFLFKKKFDNGDVEGNSVCGATIINEYWLLTAAHCFMTLDRINYIAIVGDNNLKTKDEGEQLFSVDSIYIHEKFSARTKENDIALLKIKLKNGKGIVFNKHVQPACLPDIAAPFVEGTNCTISGWGNVENRLPGENKKIGVYPDVLKSVTVPLISQKVCHSLNNNPPHTFITSSMFCAGHLRGGKDSCDGDSGGPLICNFAGAYTVYGVISWGIGCAMSNYPGVYTRVTAFLPWIHYTINVNSVKKEQKLIPKK